jgi:hypothetical protein
MAVYNMIEVEVPNIPLLDAVVACLDIGLLGRTRKEYFTVISEPLNLDTRKSTLRLKTSGRRMAREM